MLFAIAYHCIGNGAWCGLVMGRYQFERKPRTLNDGRFRAAIRRIPSIRSTVREMMDRSIDGDREANQLLDLITRLYAFSACLTRTCSSAIACWCSGLNDQSRRSLAGSHLNLLVLSTSGCRPAFRSCKPGVNAGDLAAA